MATKKEQADAAKAKVLNAKKGNKKSTKANTPVKTDSEEVKQDRRRSKIQAIAKKFANKPEDIGNLVNPLHEKKAKRALAVAIGIEVYAVAKGKKLSEEARHELLVASVAHSGILYNIGSKYDDELSGYAIEATRYSGFVAGEIAKDNGYPVQHKDKVDYCLPFAKKMVAGVVKAI